MMLQVRSALLSFQFGVMRHADLVLVKGYFSPDLSNPEKKSV